nr:AMP-binding protein [Rhodococcus sp. JVH1]
MAGSGTRISYRELDRRSMSLAVLLRRRGLSAGDTIAVVAENRIGWAEVIWATARAGFDIAPVNWHLGGDELCAVLGACDARRHHLSGLSRGSADSGRSPPARGRDDLGVGRRRGRFRWAGKRRRLRNRHAVSSFRIGIAGRATRWPRDVQCGDDGHTQGDTSFRTGRPSRRGATASR